MKLLTVVICEQYCNGICSAGFGNTVGWYFTGIFDNNISEIQKGTHYCSQKDRNWQRKPNYKSGAY